jgi:hypothetical protein
VLWEQVAPPSYGSCPVCNETPDDPAFSYLLADDFVNPVPWSIGVIYVPGETIGSLFNATALHWAIYADNGGKPDGYLNGSGNPPVWTLTLAPTDPQVTITNGNWFSSPSNALLTLDTPVTLPPGHWWLVYYPTMNHYSNGSMQWHNLLYAVTSNGYHFQWTMPSWTEWRDGDHDFAFRLEGPSSAQALKREALNDLNKMLGDSLQQKQCSLIKMAATLITQSLKPTFWLDDSHLQETSGSQVFTYEQSAAGFLLQACACRVNPAVLDPILDALVRADQLLASEAIDDAICAGGNTGKIKTAQKYLDKGDCYAAAGFLPVNAIEAYRNAWKYAVSAY